MIIDIHSHILPCVDDGSASVEESIAMLQREYQQGIRRVVATPHFYPQNDRPERFLARRQRAVNKLLEAVQDVAGIPEIHLGAEVYYFPGISESDILPELTIGKKRCILLEMPMPPWTDRMYTEIRAIREKQDLIPVIAHIDRYIMPFQTYGIPARLEQLPVLVQANASFFLNGITRPMALRLLKEDRIHLLGSDCHNMTDRVPRLGDAVRVIEKKLGTDILERIDLYQEQIFNDGID